MEIERHSSKEELHSIYLDNTRLATALEERSQEIARLRSENADLCKERDQLLATIKRQPRQQHDAATQSSPNDDISQSVLEKGTSKLSATGNCQCCVSQLKACNCVLTETKLREDIIRLNTELDEQKRAAHDATAATEAYRLAFEEQLSRSRALLQKMVELSTAPSQNRLSKVRAAFKWFLQQLNEDIPSTRRKESRCDSRKSEEQRIRSGTATTNPQPSPTDDQKAKAWEQMTDDEIIFMLVDMLGDKSEALAHQRLAARILAAKNRDLENRLSSIEDLPEEAYFST